MRRLFFASAALLMFAMAYQLGVRNAGAQASPVVEAVSYDNGAVFVVVGDAWQQIDHARGSGATRRSRSRFTAMRSQRCCGEG